MRASAAQKPSRGPGTRQTIPSAAVEACVLAVLGTVLSSESPLAAGGLDSLGATMFAETLA